MISLDVENAFNTLSRAYLITIFLQTQPGAAHSDPLLKALPDSTPSDSDLGHYILSMEPHFQSKYSCKSVLNLKLYHYETTQHILSESGVQQSDPLGSALFAFLPGCLVEAAQKAQRHPAVLVTGYADDFSFLGPLQAVTKPDPDSNAIVQEENQQLKI